MTTDRPGPPANWKASFFPIWSGQAISLLGSRVVQFALVWWLTELTGSPTVLATAALVAVVPEIILGPIAGAYVDRWSRRLIMIVSDGLVALGALWLAYLFWTDGIQIWHVYAIMFMRAVVGTFQFPAFIASTSLMVPEDQLTRVAGLNQTIYGALNIVGPPLGALLMGLLPLSGVMMVDVFTALLAVLPLLLIQVPRPGRRPGEEGKPSIWSDLRLGLNYIWGWKGLVALIGVAMMVKLVITPAFVLLPLLVSDFFKGGPGQLSLLEALAGLGIILGGLLLSLWGGFRRRIYTTLVGLFVLGLSMLLLGLTPATLFILALASVLFVGLTIPLIDGPLTAILQASVTPDMQGKVFTMMGSLVAVVTPISLVVAGPVSEWLGLKVWFIAAGLVCAGLGAGLFFVPVVVHIEDEKSGPAGEAELPEPASQPLSPL